MFVQYSLAHILGVLKHLILLYLKTSIQEMTIISHFIAFIAYRY